MLLSLPLLLEQTFNRRPSRVILPQIRQGPFVGSDDFQLGVFGKTGQKRLVGEIDYWAASAWDSAT